MDTVSTPWGEVLVSVDAQECPGCGNIGHVYEPRVSNRSIQVRCGSCGRWLMNAKYDQRGKNAIRREEINKWLTKREC